MLLCDKKFSKTDPETGNPSKLDQYMTYSGKAFVMKHLLAEFLLNDMYDPLEPRPYTAMARRFIESKFVLTGMSDLVGLEQLNIVQYEQVKY